MRGNYFDNYYYNDNNDVKRSYFDHRLQFNVEFMPSDAITMHVRTTALKDQMWGHQRSNLEWSGKSGAPGATANNAGTLNANIGGRDYSGSLEVYQAWMDIKSAYGTFLRRPYAFRYRRSGPVWGTASRSWATSCPLTAGAERDRIKWVWSSGPLTLLALYQKTAERDADIDQNAGYAEDNMDAEYWCFSPKYMWDTGGASIGLNYSTDDADPNNELSYFWLTPALRLVFGQFEVDFEGGFGWGEVGNVDLEGVRFYLDRGLHLRSGVKLVSPTCMPRVTIPTQPPSKATEAASAATTVRCGEPTGAGGIPTRLKQTTTGAWLLFWQHNITEDLMLHAAYGFLNVNEPGAGVDDDYGSEFDLGIQYLHHEEPALPGLPGLLHSWWLHGRRSEDTTPDNALAFRHELRLDF